MNENGSVLDTNDVSRSMAQTQWLLLYGTLDNKKRLHNGQCSCLRGHNFQEHDTPSSSNRSFFSVQRLHGFRQVVQHVQLHVAN